MLTALTLFNAALAAHLVADRKAYKNDSWTPNQGVLRQRVVSMLRAEVLRTMRYTLADHGARHLDPWSEVVLGTGQLHVGFSGHSDVALYVQLAFDLSKRLPSFVGEVLIRYGDDARPMIYVQLNPHTLDECSTPECVGIVALASQAA